MAASASPDEDPRSELPFDAEQGAVGIAVSETDSGGVQIPDQDLIVRRISQHLESSGYAVQETRFRGFGAATGPVLDVVSGLPLGVIWKVVSWGWNCWGERKKKRIKENLRNHWPLVYIQLVMTNLQPESKIHGKVVARILSVLVSTVEDLRQDRLHRRFMFIIYGDSPDIRNIHLWMEDPEITPKNAAKIIRSLEKSGKLHSFSASFVQRKFRKKRLLLNFYPE